MYYGVDHKTINEYFTLIDIQSLKFVNSASIYQGQTA